MAEKSKIQANLTLNETPEGVWEIRTGKGELIATCPNRKRGEQVAVALTYFRKAIQKEDKKGK